MDFNATTLFGTMKKKLAWLTQRQEVLAKNIANADTPGYNARDIKPIDFKKEVRRAKGLKMEVTSPVHLAGASRAASDFDVAKDRRPYETAPAGNSVILEEQMQKLNETGTTHRLMTELYKKNLNMFKIALGR